MNTFIHIIILFFRTFYSPKIKTYHIDRNISLSNVLLFLLYCQLNAALVRLRDFFKIYIYIYYQPHTNQYTASVSLFIIWYYIIDIRDKKGLLFVLWNFKNWESNWIEGALLILCFFGSIKPSFLYKRRSSLFYINLFSVQIYWILTTT